MGNGADSFTAERVAELRKDIDLSEIPEIKDFLGGHLRNRIASGKAVPLRIDNDSQEWLGQPGAE